MIEESRAVFLMIILQNLIEVLYLELKKRLKKYMKKLEVHCLKAHQVNLAVHKEEIPRKDID